MLLIKQLVGESNRMFAGKLIMFSLLEDIDISYKTVERLYYDEVVALAIHNLLILKKKEVKESDGTGDGTGYPLTIKKNNYESYAQEDKAKEEKGSYEDNNSSKSNSNKSIAHRRNLFVYTFTIMNLATRLYLAYGSSTKSERNAFDKAMLADMDVDVKSIRLDRYYSFPTYVDKFDGSCKVYVLPKKNSTLNGSQKCKDTIKEFTRVTMEYLEQYHQRSNSESGFAADNKMLGWGPEKRGQDQ